MSTSDGPAPQASTPANTTTRAGATTSDVILGAAFQILAREGYQGLTARSVAEKAGTNLALVNYYFGGKRGMLLALYERLEQDRYQRQKAMYADPSEPLSTKFRRAIEFYREDLSDGFVRVHHELQAQGFADQALAERAKQRVVSWSELLEDVAAQYLPSLGVNWPADRLVVGFAAFWYGMEQHHLLGLDESQTPYFAVLDGIVAWLEQREAAAARQD